ncbi:MAG: amino acid ABC transporter permease [Elusimicrobiota bacterium]|jgi:putative glutamine transport system permease protein|nr:amino acid ABC transporter permease [Elusimicrobiota bacterium]
MKMVFTYENIIFLFRGLQITLTIAFSTIALSFVFGSILGIARFSGKGILAKLAAIYIDTVRNIPLLLFIIGFRFTLPLPPVASAIASMTVFTSAMVAEIVRGGLHSVAHGQWEAAYSQGFSYIGTMLHIILPQAVKKILKPLMSQFVTAIKDTSFCAIIAVHELMYSGMIIMGKFVTSTQAIVLYALIALIYFTLNTALLKLSNKIKF